MSHDRCDRCHEYRGMTPKGVEMSRAGAGPVVTWAIVAIAWTTPARAQQDVLDIMMLLGRSETLRLPGVERVEERPEEKNPPSLHSRMIEGTVLHRPLESRLHPMESYTLEPKPSTLEEAAEESMEGPAPSLPHPPAPLGMGPNPGPPEAASSVTGLPDLGLSGPPDGLTLDAAI